MSRRGVTARARVGVYTSDDLSTRTYGNLANLFARGQLSTVHVCRLPRKANILYARNFTTFEDLQAEIRRIIK